MRRRRPDEPRSRCVSRPLTGSMAGPNRRTASCVDVDARRREATDRFPRAVESCEGARTFPSRGAQSETLRRARDTELLCLGIALESSSQSFTASTATPYAQTAVASRTRAHVEFLASNGFEGREAGSTGERLAGGLPSPCSSRASAQSRSGHASVFLPFEFTAGTRDGGSAISGPRDTHARDTEQRCAGPGALLFGRDALTDRRPADTGSSLLPASQSFGYDGYTSLDVKDKMALTYNFSQKTSILKRRLRSPLLNLHASQPGKVSLIVTHRSPDGLRQLQKAL